jgi:hypothetical protein
LTPSPLDSEADKYHKQLFYTATLAAHGKISDVSTILASLAIRRGWRVERAAARSRRTTGDCRLRYAHRGARCWPSIARP